MFRRDQDETPDFVFDPMADLFFSVVAIVVLAVIIILPTIRLQASITPEVKAPPVFQIDGRAVDPIRATAAGLMFGPNGGSHVALNAIDEDEVLAATIRRAAESGLPLLLLIEPDGDEAAFQLEPVLAHAGVTSIRQVRLDAACSHMRNDVSGGACTVAVHADRAP